jgi:hypothetical protein
MIGSFLMGVITGAAAVYLYGPQIREYVDEKTKAARSRAADTLQAASEGLQAAKETVEGGLGGQKRRAG